MKDKKIVDDVQRSAQIWAIYEDIKSRGHTAWAKKAKRCEEMYWGGGMQWTDDDKEYLTSQGRPFYEFNEIRKGVDIMLAYHQNNKMDIMYRPVGGDSDMANATVMNRVAKSVTDENNYHKLEGQVYGDGMITGRGFWDIRMDYTKSVRGRIRITVLDPKNVMIDSDANSNDPEDWARVLTTKWWTADEIEMGYGKSVRSKVENNEDPDNDFGVADNSVKRNRFGNDTSMYSASWTDDVGIKRYRLIEMQERIYTLTDVVIIDDDDIVVIEGYDPIKVQEMVARGAIVTKRMMKRIRWTVATKSTVVKDETSPYDHYTIVMYAPFFRNGWTQGMVENAIDPQEALNKFMSTYIHVVGATANGGYFVKKGSLTNFDVEELKEQGSRTGLVMEYEGDTPPQKIPVNQVPGGIDKFLDRTFKAVRDATVPEAARGEHSDEKSGVAIQAKQFAAQQQMAVPLANLAFARSIIAKIILKLTQKYMTGPRIIRMTEMDPQTGKEILSAIEVNQVQMDGTILNDLTVGDYDVMVGETPAKDTYDATDLTQMLEMRALGINIPDEYFIMKSNISDRSEIVAAMAKRSAAQPPDPMVEAQAELMKAQTAKVAVESENIRAKTFETNIKGLYGAVQAAGAIAMNAPIAGIADTTAKSAGFKDLDMAPIYGSADGIGSIANSDGNQLGNDLPANTNPMQPVPPISGVNGVNQGIETLRNDANIVDNN